MSVMGQSDDWPFDDPPNVAIITTRGVVNEGRPILFVFHNEDGYWQFHCDREPKEEDIMIVSLALIVQRDPGIKVLADLPYGWRAWREQNDSEWHRCLSPDADEDREPSFSLN